MKILFVDIDGVLNNTISSMVQNIKNPDRLNPHIIDQHNLNVLRIIATETDAKIVITSTWRKDTKVIGNAFTDKEKIKIFKNIFSSYDWEDAPIIGITPNLSGFRGHEVADYLTNLSKTELIEDYLILDDDSDFILGDLLDLPVYRLEKMNLLEEKDRTNINEYYHHQKFLKINPLTGLSYDNLITMLHSWSPEHELIKNHQAYEPYLSKCGKRHN